MKNLVSTISIIFFGCFLIGSAFAEDHLTRLYVFQHSCTKACHTSPNNGNLIKPEYKTTSEWNDLLKNNQKKLRLIHKGIKLDLSYINKKHPNLDKNAWEIVKEQLLTYAYDSEQPDEKLFR